MTTKQSKNKVKKTSEAMEKKKYKKSVLEYADVQDAI